MHIQYHQKNNQITHHKVRNHSLSKNYKNLYSHKLDKVFCSQAIRAKETFDLTADGFNFEIDKATYTDKLYFGDTTNTGTFHGTSASPTRGIIAGAFVPGATNVIQFITFMTTGDAQDFGDLAVIGASQTGAASSPTRGVIMGGIGGSPRAATNTTQKIEILTEGNSVDFGDITTARNGGGGISNAHGGR